jgi:hypothetical protein
MQNNEDYKDVTIDHSEFERWPPVWVAENLPDLAGTVQSGGRCSNRNCHDGLRRCEDGTRGCANHSVWDNRHWSGFPTSSAPHTSANIPLQNAQNNQCHYWKQHLERKRRSFVLHIGIPDPIPLGHRKAPRPSTFPGKERKAGDEGMDSTTS